jgi:hypothetical protein
MQPRFQLIRRLTGALAIPIALLLLGATLAGGLHHHGGAQSRDTCALCTASHTPAVASIATASPGPALGAERVVVWRAPRAHTPALPRPSSRAPPLA